MRAGVLTVGITPSHPAPLAGFTARRGDFTRIDTPLEANLAAFADRDGQPVVLGSVDTLFVGPSVRTAIAEAAGIPARRLVLVATHTHNAPSLAPEIPRLGPYDPAYGDMVVQRIGEAVRRLIARPGPALSVGHARRHAPFNVNRRRPAWVLDYSALRHERRLRFGKVIAMAPHRDGTVDPTLRCIVLRDAASAVRAVIWSFPCHANRYPRPDHVSADFPGLVRNRLRAVFGEACAVLYLPGLAGSAIPDIPFAAPRSLRDLVGQMLPFNPVLPSFTLESYRAWGEALSQVALACAGAAGAVNGGAAVTHRSARSPRVFVGDGAGGCPDIALDFVRLDFGETCGVVAMTGEMVGEWSPILQPLLPEGWIATGYLAGPSLYVPTDRLVREGGYEADRFRQVFGLPGGFVAGLVPIVRRSLDDLSRVDTGFAATPDWAERPPSAPCEAPDAPWKA
ncbi:hypothetical protein [Azospirillum doebereinerae]|uniref:Neutral/alkaline non-lysosomal ceramidase N-terminal domain-containing protein n=1 Tax=Azospirillum doebereinerae TaxID=92933 RepID=A0A3S0XN92_9PROT|nr:hypothetical protein [Azospirillum doebereinerae]RUQ72078.1 hypothetical protein EJ913_10955 [Azospirillum doebereinerae]